MARAHFEKREYESAFNAELVERYGFARRLWTPGTVIEKVLGYDLAAGRPSRDAVWRLLAVPRPIGVRLLPGHWQSGSQPPAGRLPSDRVSLILQFKRPEYLASHSAKQYRMWRSPYFRFTRNARQHAVLRRLEQRAGVAVVVRYAAPAFHMSTELEGARLTGEVCSRSGYVSPDRLGAHIVWTYQMAGHDGRPNPAGARLRFETIDDLQANLLGRSDAQPLLVATEGSGEVARTPQDSTSPDTQDLSPYPGPLDELEPLASHLQTLSASLTYRSPSLRNPLRAWRQALDAADLGISSRALDVAVDIATVQTAMTAVGATWLIYSN